MQEDIPKEIVYWAEADTSSDTESCSVQSSPVSKNRFHPQQVLIHSTTVQRLQAVGFQHLHPLYPELYPTESLTRPGAQTGAQVLS